MKGNPADEEESKHYDETLNANYALIGRWSVSHIEISICKGTRKCPIS